MQISPHMDSKVVYITIKNFPDYMVGDDGSIWSNKQKYWGYNKGWYKLLPAKDGGGKLFVYLSNKTLNKPKMKKIHRLVLENFIGDCPVGMEGCHNNGIADDNRLSNLRWDTHSNNEKDKLIHDTHVRGDRNGNAKLSENDAREIKILLKDNKMSQVNIAKKFDITPHTISKIKAGILWKWLEV